ncbi:MAG: hypothetical protein H6744_21035 [Deltaproteobacteria bacterium]|nr:hypothetical protein [Deltaproteobacteria bacterium]MCB9789169.1 hypothetical protein [Deltaproteobacteria bacterium]
MDAAVARRALEAAAPGPLPAQALLRFPQAMAATARALKGALEARGVEARLELVGADRYSDPDLRAAADAWVPAPGAAVPPLVLLAGARPWSEPFDGDHRVEIQAMQHREALSASGRRLVFVEWPTGARRDAEVDLDAAAMAAIFQRAVGADLAAIRAWNARLAAALDGARDVHLRCPAGTSLTLSVAGRRFIAEDCLLGAAEPVVYLPGGEIYAPAVESSAEGQVAFRHCGEPRVAHFAAGALTAVTDASGRADADLASELGLGAEPLCELGFGTNPWAPPWQIGTLYEKSAGTAHVAVGGNAHFGGQRHSPRHADLIIREPTVTVDGVPLELPPPLWREPPEESLT